MAKTGKSAVETKQPKQAAKKQDSSSDSSSEEEEEPKHKAVVNKKAAAAPAPASAKKQAKKDSSSDDSSSSEEEKPVKPAPKKAAPVKAAAKKESSSDDSSSEEEKPAAKPAAKAAPAKAAAKKEESSSDDSSSSDEEEKAEPQKRKADADNAGAKRAKTEEASGEEGATVSLWVGGLPWAVDKDGLKEHLESLGHGDISDAYVAFDKETGKSRGFGYAYCSAETANAIAARTDVEINGRTLRFDVDAGKGKKDQQPAGGDRRQSFGDRPKSAPGNSLICRNLSYNVDNEVLQNHFENATGARVITNPEDGSSKGCVTRCPSTTFNSFSCFAALASWTLQVSRRHKQHWTASTAPSLTAVPLPWTLLLPATPMAVVEDAEETEEVSVVAEAVTAAASVEDVVEIAAASAAVADSVVGVAATVVASEEDVEAATVVALLARRLHLMTRCVCPVLDRFQLKTKLK